MKKTFLAMMLAGCSCAVFAQDDSLKTNSNTTNATMNSTNTTNSMNNSLSSSSSYNAYSTFNATPPESVKNYVTRDYPATTGTTVYWQQNSPDWWHGYYLTNGQPTHVYYSTSWHVPTAGQSFTVALPVRQTYVPDAVVSKSIEMFGPTLYDINAVKGSARQDLYVVRLVENGQLSSQYIDDNGNKVLDVYRVETMDNNAAMSNDVNSNMSSGNSSATETSTSANATTTDANAMNTDVNKVKIKTKTSDGKKTKTKIVKGQQQTKEF